MSEETRYTTSNFFSDVLRFTLITFAIVIPFRLFVAQPFIVNGQSMDPTFDTGEYLIVDQITYRFEDPKRNDVVVFRYPKQPSKFFIKRIIGLPGETVVLQEGVVNIYNDDHPNGFTLDEPYITHKSRSTLSLKLEDDEYFVMGDNRISSSDSRSWGPLEEHFIQGRPIVRLLPINEIDFMPGAYEE